MAHTLSLRDLQRAAFTHVLRLGYAEDSEAYWQHAWKVLIYDDATRDALAPLMRLDEIRDTGVTLHLGLHHPRSALPGVASLYIVSPNQKNISRIAEDCASSLYEQTYVCFTSPASTRLLESFAEMLVERSAVSKVTKIFEHHLQFAALENNLFDLRIRNSLVAIESQKMSDEDSIAHVEQVVQGLLGVCITLGMVPVIRSPPHGAPSLVAKSLAEALREELAHPNSELKNTRGSSDRPVLVIAPRSYCIGSAAAHDWSYQGLLHDIHGIDLNRLTLPSDDGTVRKCELDDRDSFFTSHATSPFPEVAQAIKNEVSTVEKAIKETGGSASEADLSLKVGALPQLQAKKESLGNHTHAAWALLQSINARNVDRLVQLEAGVAQGRENARKDAIKALSDSSLESKDRLRLAAVIVASNPKAEVDVSAVLSAVPPEDAPIMRVVRTLASSMPTPTTTKTPNWLSRINNVTSVVQGLVGGGEAQWLPLTRMVGGCMEHEESYANWLYLDPHVANNVNPTRRSGPFRDAIACVLGGGCYAEAHNLRLFAQTRSAQAAERVGGSALSTRIIYGATEILRGDALVEQLRALASEGTQ